MNKTNTDKKLELIRSIRIQNQYDRQTLRRREGILYDNPVNIRQGEIYGLEDAVLTPLSGKHGSKQYINTKEGDQTLETGGLLTGFRIRFVLAMVLFLGFIYCDMKQVSVCGINCSEILQMLKEDLLN